MGPISWNYHGTHIMELSWDPYHGTIMGPISWNPNLFSHGTQIYFQTRQHLANGNSSEFLGQTDCVLLISLRHGVSSELSSDNRVFQWRGIKRRRNTKGH